ncbi:MAG: pyridoxamine 5'-phosphate oxidase family protein [Phototrophicaceae bacterium]
MRWEDFARAAPELAGFGRQRLEGRIAYLATSRADGSPRVHPVSPILGGGYLLLFMYPTSPKGKDLQRDDRYALHCAVEDKEGGSGEFHVRGRARLVDAPEYWQAASPQGETLRQKYILFELGVDFAQSTVYTDDRPVHQRWSSA